MTWDYAVGQEFVKIEAVEGGEVVCLIVEIPYDSENAQSIAEAICNAHNRDAAS